MKFKKIGDRIKVVSIKSFAKDDNKDYPKHFFNEEGVIIKIFDFNTNCPYIVKFDNKLENDDWAWSEENLELCEGDIHEI